MPWMPQDWWHELMPGPALPHAGGQDDVSFTNSLKLSIRVNIAPFWCGPMDPWFGWAGTWDPGTWTQRGPGPSGSWRGPGTQTQRGSIAPGLAGPRPGGHPGRRGPAPGGDSGLAGPC